jgi:hypothetical protein
MALVVTPNLTDISLCEAVGNWSAGAVNSAFKLEGTNCLGLKVSEAESALITWTFGSSQNMTNKNVYFWVQVQGNPDTKANGGIRFYAEDNAGHYGYFNIAGGDNYPGGWQCYCFYPGATYTTGSGTVDVANITKVGVRFKILSKALGNNPNCFWDAVRYGTGLTLTSGAADAVDIDDIIAAEENDKYWGVLKKVDGVFYQQGKLIFGDASGTGNIDFIDKLELLVFKDLAFAQTTFSGLEVVGNATGATNFILGEASGGRGISGCILKSAGTQKFTFTAIDTDIDKLQIYGTSFLDAGAISFPVSATNREVLSCNFEQCAEILADTCIVKYCNIVASDARGLRIASASHQVTDCNFINCPHCVHCNLSVAVTFDNLKFSGSDGSSKYDIEHSVSGTLTVNCTNDSNPNSNYVHETGGGSTTINNAVYLIVYAEDEEGDDLENVQVAIYKVNDDSQLMNEVTDGSGKAEETFNYASDTDIYVRLRRSSVGSTRLLPIATSGKITSGGYILTAVMHEDVIAA